MTCLVTQQTPCYKGGPSRRLSQLPSLWCGVHRSVGVVRSPGLASDPRLFLCRAVSERTERATTPLLENASQEPYCDDFQCTSSPAVETSVRSFARDLMRLRYTQSLFAKDVTYTDGVRSFRGSNKYPRLTWHTQMLSKPSVVIITKMRMLDKGSAQLDWALSGQYAGNSVTVPAVTVIQMNLVTGRIVDHKDRWDLSQVGGIGSVLLTLSHVAWAAQQGSRDLSESLSGKVSAALNTLDGGDKSPDIYSNPSDPTRFFQNQQGGQEWNDYVSYAFLAALLYLAVQAFTELNKL